MTPSPTSTAQEPCDACKNECDCCGDGIMLHKFVEHFPDGCPHRKAGEMEKLLNEYEASMTRWMREPEQYRQMITDSTNKVLALARWALEAKEALEKAAHVLELECSGAGQECFDALSHFPSIR